MTDISSQTLHIVAKELTATLNEARAALEAYAERSDQNVFLEKCADQLHLAHRVLRLVEVSTYLERVLSGGRDLALVLLPLLNDLRSVRGSPLLSEGTLLLLNLKS